MKRGPVTSRYQRFNLEKEVTTIVRNARSRCACFWLKVVNVSASGLGIEYRGHGHIPFSVGDELYLTVDMTTAIFRRPIHLKAVVKRRTETPFESETTTANKIFLGIEILSIDVLHQKAWMEGLTKLGDPNKMDPFARKEKAIA